MNAKKPVYENEKWWQENGLGWADEVWKRRASQPLYSIQEIVLSSYFKDIPEKSKVLEFGVGFGRHIEYLNKLNNLELYGVDQSPTMLESLRKRFGNNKDLMERIVLIEPRSKLPYPDNYFDIVYTVSVLIHIKPEHINQILSELIRVSKHGLIHFENKEEKTSTLSSKDHNGCWVHDLKKAYKSQGVNANIMDQVSGCQDVYFAKLSNNPYYDFNVNPVILERIRLLDERIRPRIAFLEGEVGWRTNEIIERQNKEELLKGDIDRIKLENTNLIGEKKELSQINLNLSQSNLKLVSDNSRVVEEKNALNDKINILNQEKNALNDKMNILVQEKNELNERVKLNKEQQLQMDSEIKNREAKYEKLSTEHYNISNINEQLVQRNTYLEDQVNYYNSVLDSIYSSLGWKITNKIRNMERLYVFIKPLRSFLKNITNKKNKKQIIKESFVQEESPCADILSNDTNMTHNVKMAIEYLDFVPIDSVLAIHHPDWLGVSNSTKELFPYTMGIREILTEEESKKIADLITENKIHTVVFSGFADGWGRLAKHLKMLHPEIKIMVFWHGNTTHMYEDYSWFRYQEIISLCHDKIVDNWGFAKESMAKLYAEKGFNTAFIMNHVTEKTNLQEEINKQGKNSVDKEKIHIGLYASGYTWNKNAYTQIAAASLLGDIILQATPYNERMKQFAKQLGVNIIGNTSSVSREELLLQMAKNTINLYVTFSECAPLLPLESLNLGIPCLTGPNHHYFKGTKLEDYLVVQYPDDPLEIAKKAKKAIEDKGKIIELYHEWVEKNKSLAENSVENFLGCIDK